MARGAASCRASAAVAWPSRRGRSVVALGEDGGRYLLEVVYRVRGQAVPFGTILAARRKKETLLAAAGGLLDPQHPRYGWMDGLEKSALSGRGARLRLHLAPLEVCRVRSYLPPNHQVTGAGASAEALARLEDLAADAPAPPPEELGLPLFDFQRTGYSWLWFLYRNGFGGLLCDDMGLGKTWQAVALLAAMARESGRPPRVLVVCPASVLPHWDETLRRLAPGLPVRRHHGAARGPAEAGERVLLTTYGTLRNDAAALAGTPFDLFVLDEVQTVKNRGTATHQALRAIRAGTVVGLTGTPVENGVEELRTLLDFVLPGYLPPEAEFRKSFVRPIEDGDAAARERLRRLVRPFVLRRTKSQVALGLPEKLLDRRECEMTPGQAALYRVFLEQRGGPLRAALEGPGPGAVPPRLRPADEAQAALRSPRPPPARGRPAGRGGLREVGPPRRASRGSARERTEGRRLQPVPPDARQDGEPPDRTPGSASRRSAGRRSIERRPSRAFSVTRRAASFSRACVPRASAST